MGKKGRKKYENPTFSNLYESLFFSKSDTELAKDLDVSRSTVNEWKNNKSFPDIASLVEISKMLNVSVDYLLGLTKNNALDGNIQTVQKYTGLSENAIKALKHEGFNGEIGNFISGFVESKDFYRFVLAFSNAYFLAQNVTADNKDAFLDESLIFENGECLDITVRITMMDAVDNMCRSMCDYFNKYAHSYFERMAEIYSTITVEQIIPIEAHDDSEVK